jgi:glycosyltransferase involved in cell wall biosynthesis
MGRHQILSRLAREFPVVWVDPAREWRDVLRAATSPRASLQFRLDVPGIAVYRHSPFLPRLYRPKMLARFTERRRIEGAVRRLRIRGHRRVVFSIWTPDGLPALDAWSPDFATYHIRDEYSFSDVDQTPDQVEVELMGRVERVYVASPGLLESKRRFAPDAVMIPNGVDYQAFASPHPEPADLAQIPRPRVGYVGWLKDQLDGPLLVHLAKSRPRWSFVFIGPHRTTPGTAPTVRALRALPNVYFLGTRLPAHLPAWVQHLDVGLLPYRVTDYSRYIYPLKLHEYLAAGIPVVSAPIRTVLDFPDVVTIASSPQAWEAAIAEALAPEAAAPERVAARRAVARRHDWDALVERVALPLREVLGSA